VAPAANCWPQAPGRGSRLPAALSLQATLVTCAARGHRHLRLRFALL
jgi:hypothetical protein